MRQYLRYFRIPFIIAGVMTLVSLVMYFTAKSSINTERNNTSWDNSVCVLDTAGKMTESERQQLNDYIMEIEERCQADIVFITMDNADYGYLDKVRQYADRFAEDNSLGFDYPGGSSIVFVDNWSRGGDGRIHSWISTTGTIRQRLTDEEATRILNILDDIASDYSDPYNEYYRIATALGRKGSSLQMPFSMALVLVIALIVSVIYVVVNWKSKLGDVTVEAGTYVDGGNGKFKVATDMFTHKTVSKRRIERSSGGSGGGGGGSHGGGGHSR